MKKGIFLGPVLVMLTSVGFLNAQTVKIGKQIWMAENLNVDKFRNGDPIPQIKSAEEWIIAGENKEPAWCYYHNDSTNGSKYGKIYNWYAVVDPRGIAPKGWHVPTEDEWLILADNLGGQEEAGSKIKSTTGWNYGGNGTNNSGFTGLPGGFRGPNGSFYMIGDWGFWWSCTENVKGDVWSCDVGYESGKLFMNLDIKNNGIYVRCIKN